MVNERAKAILIGTILGDGYLTTPSGRSQKSSLDIKVAEEKVAYLEWMRRELLAIGVSELKQRKDNQQYRFVTRRSLEIGQLRKTFYPNGKKAIPKNIDQLLSSPLTLAVWYQDDGTLDCRDRYHYNALFATHCFSFHDCELLTSALRKNFKLDVRVCRCQMRGKVNYRLYVVSKSMDDFIGLIRPYIQPCFQYKIRSLPVSQQQR